MNYYIVAVTAEINIPEGFRKIGHEKFYRQGRRPIFIAVGQAGDSDDVIRRFTNQFGENHVLQISQPIQEEARAQRIAAAILNEIKKKSSKLSKPDEQAVREFARSVRLVNDE